MEYLMKVSNIYRKGVKEKKIYEGELYATVLSTVPYGSSLGFVAKPELSIEGVSDEVFVLTMPPKRMLDKELMENFWGAHLRKGDRVYMKGTLIETEIKHWGTKKNMFMCNLLYNEAVKSGYGIRNLKTKESHFRGRIGGIVTGLIETKGFGLSGSVGSAFGRDFSLHNFLSLGLELEEKIAGLPEELTVHTLGAIPFSLGDWAIVDGEILSFKLKGTNFEIFEMMAEHYLNKNLNMGF